MTKLRCYITSPVFKEIAMNEKVSEFKKLKLRNLWNDLESKTELKESKSRFPSEFEIKQIIDEWNPDIIGCHLSHHISEEMLNNSDVVAVCTSTAGYNHINQYPGVLITHTPGVLHNAVADFTIALILSNLRNIVGLHNFVWNGKWKLGQKWDLDENLNTTIDSKIIGIIGLGEIGKELARRLSPWGVKILYYDLKKQQEFENEVRNLSYVNEIKDIFSTSDVVSVHIPLNSKTQHLIGKKYLKLMKKNALLVNTARGAIINFTEMIDLLEREEIEINLAFDVYENEPISHELLERFKIVAERNKDLKFLFVPHTASADADTRAEMAIMLLEDILKIATSKSQKDLIGLRLIPEQKGFLKNQEKESKLASLRINNFWR